MLKIYGVYRSRASRNIWLAHELGLPFELVPVIQHDRLADASAAKVPLDTRSPEFLKINPNGRIPSIDDDGLVLHESLAINLYLAKKHGGPLAPKSVAEDGEMGAWSLCGPPPGSNPIRSTSFTIACTIRRDPWIPASPMPRSRL